MNKLNPPIYFYIVELFYRNFYLFFSFCCCLLVSYFNIQVLFLIETYPFLLFSRKKFIATYVTDLFDCIWLLLTSTSFLFIFPLFIFHLIHFSKSSWYNYQFYLAKYLFVIAINFYWIFMFLCYLNIFPAILNFFTQWEIKEFASILDIKIEFRIFDYINWILKFRYLLNFINFCFITFLIKILFLFSLKNIYKNIKIYRKQFCFCTILLIFFSTPPDFYLQLFTITIIFIFYELVFFLVCYKIYNSDLNAYSPSINKNSKET